MSSNPPMPAYSMSASRQALVATQFGPRARAYVESADHARGGDLDRLATLVAARPGGRVLDLGCGGGHVSFTVAPFAREVIAYDLSPEMLAAVTEEAARRGLHAIRTVRGVAEAIPFEDASFDMVMTRYSAHHWSDLAAGLRGIRRVVKPGGLVVVMDTVSPGEPAADAFLHDVETLRDPSHGKNYTPSQWVDALRSAGLSPAQPVLARLRLDFRAWIARIGTPETQARAIRSLQHGAPPDIVAHFAIEPDGSFTIDTMLLEAEA